MTRQQISGRRFRARRRLAAAENRLRALRVEQERQSRLVDDTNYGWHRRRYLPQAIARALSAIARASDELAELGPGRRIHAQHIGGRP